MANCKADFQHPSLFPKPFPQSDTDTQRHPPDLASVVSFAVILRKRLGRLIFGESAISRGGIHARSSFCGA